MGTPVSLTTAQLRKKIAKRTGLPEWMVAQVLDEAIKLMQVELIQQGEILIARLCRISTTIRVVARPNGGRVKRIVLTIRPVRSFRQRLNAVKLG